MKYIYNILSILCILCLFACTVEDETLNDGGIGYLRLAVGGTNETTTKAATLPEGYTGLQLAVEIIDVEGESVQKTDDWEEWKGEQIKLKAGTYTIKAYSYGFDGKQSAMAAPYYYGSKQITIEAGKELNETVVCSLANVKMSVKVSDDIKANFNSFSVSVNPKTAGACDPLTFNIDLTQEAITDTAYFPATELVVNYSATNKKNQTNSAKRELAGVEGNDHYILNFTLAESVDVDDPVSVVVDPTMHTYTYTFQVSTKPTNKATLSANAWAKFAYLNAEDVTTTAGTDIESLKFQYRKQGTQDWTDAAATLEVENYSGKTGTLDPETTYECRMVNADGSFTTSPITFMTEAATELYNGGFENWSQDGSTIYAKNNSDPIFWDSGNKGTTTGAGALIGINPTQGVTSPVITLEGIVSKKSAELRSQSASLWGTPIKLAAGSIYTGEFQKLSGTNGAKIKFGQSISSRPISLHGYFQYAPGVVDWVGDNLPSYVKMEKNSTDTCSIYFALVSEQYVVNNDPSASDFFLMDFTKDSRVLAFGELPAELCKNTNSNWQEFTINLRYKSLEKPETYYLVIVVSASKYGDYFTGSSSSVMYIDEFSLVYDGEPTLWE